MTEEVFSCETRSDMLIYKAASRNDDHFEVFWNYIPKDNIKLTF